MKIRFTKEFIKQVKRNPNYWKDSETILKNKPGSKLIQIKINGYFYTLGKEVVIVEEKKWWQFWK